MKWNISELKSKVLELELRISSVTDPIQKYSLMHDIVNLKDMINYLSSEPVYLTDDYKFKILDDEFAFDMAHFLKSQGDDLAHLLYGTSFLHHVQ